MRNGNDNRAPSHNVLVVVMGVVHGGECCGCSLSLLLLQNGCRRYGCRGGGECGSLCDVISRQSTTQRQHNVCDVLVLEINNARHVKDDVGLMDQRHSRCKS